MASVNQDRLSVSGNILNTVQESQFQTDNPDKTDVYTNQLTFQGSRVPISEKVVRLEWEHNSGWLNEQVKLPKLFITSMAFECNTDKPFGELVKRVSLRSGDGKLQELTGSFIDSHNSIDNRYYVRDQDNRRRYLARIPFWFCIKENTYGNSLTEFVKENLPLPLSSIPAYLDVDFVNSEAKELVKLVLSCTYVDHKFEQYLKQKRFPTNEPDTFQLPSILVFDNNQTFSLSDQETTVRLPELPPFMVMILRLTDSNGKSVELESIELKSANVSVSHLPALLIENQMADNNLQVHPSRSVYHISFNHWYYSTDTNPLDFVIRLRDDPTNVVNVEMTFANDVDIVCKAGSDIYRNN